VDNLSESVGKYGATLTLDDKEFVEGMNNAEKKMDDFTDSVGGSTDKTNKKMSGFGAGLGTIAAGAIAGLGVALVGAGVAGVKMADDLQGSLNDLQASTGATEEEMKGMEDSLKNIYNNNFGESFQDIADSMALVKQNTGLTGKELESTTQNALMLRDTFGKDISESTNTANSLMKQFGISSEEAFNLMAQGIQNGADKNGDFLESLNEYAPQYKALGFSAEEFTNTLIDGAESGAFSIDKVG
jgi:phage-related minor tail protein